MNRREMILKALQTGVFISMAKPGMIIANENKSVMLKELTGNQLRFPPVFPNGGIMTLANSAVNVWSGQNTTVIAINGSYPCPSVVIQKGTQFTANFINQLTEPATIHWHGVNVPEL
ncbi:MAG TPA: multicopper oxidase domain-containing protein, partial [Ignavibacteria bacterium]|nr:multicopper oxidase domain-containing protein [Ignavibacteria bacterium]